MKRLLLLCLQLSLITAVFAQESGKKVIFTLNLKNGDVISGYTTVREIPFTTNYGSLTFPAEDLNRIQLGIKDANISKLDVYGQLDKLHFGDKDRIESIFDVLVQMEAGCLPYIKEYMASPNYRPRTDAKINVNILYEVLLGKYGLGRNYPLNDVAVFKDKYQVEGNYNFTSIPLETPYGNLDIERKRIREIEIKLEEFGEGSIKNIKLLGSKHVSGNTNGGWFNTGMLVKDGSYIEISANGNVVLASLSNNSYTPDGGVNGSPGIKDDKINYGQVIFKIGEDDKPKKAGDQFEGNLGQTGILYLSIFESVFSDNNTGYYNVRVKIVD